MTITIFGKESWKLTPAAVAAMDAEPSEVLRRWFDGLGASARLKYSQALRDFATWATGEPKPAPDSALRLLMGAGRFRARQLALGWRDSLLAAGKASGTVAGLVSALASLVTACRLCGLIDWHLEAVAPKVEPRHDRSGPPRNQVERLLAHLDELAAQPRAAGATGRDQPPDLPMHLAGDADDAEHRRALRDVAIVRMLHNCALRRSEVVSLRMQDVDLHHADGPRVQALRKGFTERQPMTIGKRAAESLAAWLRVRGDHAGPVFHRLQGAPRPEDAKALSGEAVRQMLRQRAKEAGCRATFRPHGMRHSAATWCATHGSLGDLMRLGGWATMGGAMRYVDDANPIVKPKLLDLMDL